MRHFRLVFKKNSTVLERKSNSGSFYAVDVLPGRFENDARKLDQLLSDLSGTPTSTNPAFPLD